MDVFILFIILLIVALIFKKFSNVVIFFGIIDIFLRILDYIGKNTIEKVGEIISLIFPSSIPGIISKYSEGILESILIWAYVLLMILFVYYVLKMLIHRI